MYIYTYIKDSVFNSLLVLPKSTHFPSSSVFSMLILKDLFLSFPLLSHGVCLMTIFNFFFMLLHQLKIELIVDLLHRLPSRPLGIWPQQHHSPYLSVNLECHFFLFFDLMLDYSLGATDAFFQMCFICPSSTVVATTLTQNSCFWSIHPWGKSEYQRSTMALSTLTFTRLVPCRDQSPSSMFGIQESLNTICQIELDWIVPW